MDQTQGAGHIDDASVIGVSGLTQPPPCGDPSSNKTWVHNLARISIEPDSFLNYDFHHPDLSLPNTSNQNNPINLIFWGNALTLGSTQLFDNNGIGSREWSFLAQGNGWTWAGHEGFKSATTCGTDLHYRVYHDYAATPHYNPYWGYYFVSAAHKVHGDLAVPGFGNPCSRVWYGHFEDAEQRIATLAVNTFGSSAVRRNDVFLANPEGTHRPSGGYWDGDTWRQNSGAATRIKVCLDQFGHQTQCP